MASTGGAFLQRFALVPSSGSPGKCAFCLTRDGRVVKVQRTIFSECFYVMAMDELSRVTGDPDMQVGSSPTKASLHFTSLHFNFVY